MIQPFVSPGTPRPAPTDDPTLNTTSTLQTASSLSTASQTAGGSDPVRPPDATALVADASADPATAPADPGALQALAWSPTRHAALAECHRRVYWRYWGRRGGWRADAPPQARSAWLYTHLTSVPRLIGTAVHQAATTLLACVRDRRPRPTYNDLYEGARRLLNQAWRNSQPAARPLFERWPAEHPALQEIVFWGALRPEEVESARRVLAGCIRRLVAAPLLADVEGAHPDEVLLALAGPERFTVAPGATVWCALDLAYRHQDPGTLPPDVRAAVSGPCWCVVEIKSGRPSLNEGLQLACYALWLESTGRAPTNGVFLGRITYLRGGVERWVTITADDLARARAVIADDLATQRGFFADPARGVLRPPHEIPLAADASRCPGCDLWLLCRDELARRAAAPPGARPNGAPLPEARPPSPATPAPGGTAAV